MTDWTIGLEGWLWLGTWAVVLVGVVWLLVREPHHADRDDPVAVLRGRLARGEINPDEFERAMRLVDARREP
ncbi:MAG: SHOCT domain-containing protein [Chloroflexi bacterium]|nr:SHOCT domain-containing protein [Chloroflexota bacterium]